MLPSGHGSEIEAPATAKLDRFFPKGREVSSDAMLNQPDLRIVDNSLAPNGARIDSVASPIAAAPKHVGARSEWKSKYRLQVLLTDALVVIGAVLLAQIVRFGHTPTSTVDMPEYTMVYSALIAILWLIALAAFNTRSPQTVGLGLEETRRIFAASFATFGGIAIAELLLKLEISRGYLAVAMPVGVIGLVLSRWIWREHISRLRQQGSYCTDVLAIGDREAVTSLVSELMDNPRNGYNVVGVCIADESAPLDEHLSVKDRMIPIIGGQEDSLTTIRSSGADTVALAGTAGLGTKGLQRLIWELEPLGINLMVAPGMMDVGLHRLALSPVSGLSVLHVEKPLFQRAKRFQNRVFDVGFASLALLAVLPILIVTAIAIKVTSKGPILYRSERIGLNRQPFEILKFRTMVVDADKQMAQLLADAGNANPMFFKIQNDPRITPVGRFLRRYSIDELPQFINVLRQEMSVVGPRPQVRREVEAYDSAAHRRLLVKPGITGLWQVSGRSDLPLEKAVRLDISYVDNWSMIGDLVIIAKTIRAVFAREGAY